MGKAKIEAIKKRLQAIKTPVEVRDEEGKLKRMIIPNTSVGTINIEILRRSEQVSKRTEF